MHPVPEDDERPALSPDILVDGGKEQSSPQVNISISTILPPSLLEAYDKSLPGFKNEFFAHWREDRKLAQELEMAKIKAQNRASFSVSFINICVTCTVCILILGILGVTGYLIHQGQTADAIKLLAGFAGFFILSSFISIKIRN